MILITQQIKDFQGLEIGLLEFKGFQGFSRPVRTLLFCLQFVT